MQRDQMMTLNDAAKYCPGRPHASTLWRWALKGRKTAAGERVHLQVWRYGGRWYTSRPALDDFAQALTDADRAYYAPTDHTTTSPEDATRLRKAAMSA